MSISDLIRELHGSAAQHGGRYPDMVRAPQAMIDGWVDELCRFCPDPPPKDLRGLRIMNVPVKAWGLPNVALIHDACMFCYGRDGSFTMEVAP